MNFKNFRNFKLLVIAFLACCFLQCKKETPITNSSAKLTFSTSSILFDTVFTTIGSTVRAFTVTNPYNQPIVISSIQLTGSYTSPFKINVDGAPGTSFSNIKIPAKDSIYIFVTVTINPTNKDNPLVIDDYLNFTTNGNLQKVKLEAWGQDAYFYLPNHFPQSGSAYSILPCGNPTVWRDDKPHVIYGYLVVDKGCTLAISQGTKVYMHDSAVLYIDTLATLVIGGSSTSPVTFQGDRLEPEYQNIPGQWDGIFLAPGSINNRISWAVIINGTIGIQADTVINSNPTLVMDHTIIKNMSSYGLVGVEASITADDCLIADCQGGCAYFFYGGSYQFNQCTFADYWGIYNGYSARTTPLLYINNYYQTASGATISRSINKASFGNCIIYGSYSNAEEIGLSSGGTGLFNYYFENCLLKTQQNTTSRIHYSDTNIVNQDPQFNNAANDDYHVSSTSPAIAKGNSGICGYYYIDLDGEPRSCPSTIGAYQQGSFPPKPSPINPSSTTTTPIAPNQ